MKISNKNNLPDVLVRAIEANWYSGHGEQRFASVTELLKPTKLAILGRRYGKEIAQDASDMIWTMMGSAMHKVLEAGEDMNSLAEERIAVKIDEALITGGVDFYEDGVITDFKFTTVWSYHSASRKREWEKQLNMYAYLYRSMGFEVNALQVVAIFRDWSKRRCEAEANYPKQVETIEIPLWDEQQTLAFMRSRIADLRAAAELPDDLIPECSREERWQSETQYAVFKADGKRALRVFTSRDEADAYIREHKDAAQLQIVIREEAAKRCLDYCPVKDYCHYYRGLTPLTIESLAS
jgi:hypothetical protein